jgi:hypothetical protein
MQSRIAQKWLQSVVEGLSTGEELLLPALSNKDAKEKLTLFSRELKILARVDPTATSELQITTRFKDHRFWLVVKKVAYSPLIGFKKGKNGEVERILINDSSERRRRLLLMKEDGFTVGEIQEIEGDLNEEELMLLM